MGSGKGQQRRTRSHHAPDVNVNVAATIPEADRDAVISIINADALPGQPPCTQAMLNEALAGRSPVDDAHWEELSDLRHAVARDDTGRVLGAAAVAETKNGTVTIPWLHARENPAVINALLDVAETNTKANAAVNRTAFAFATALGVGLEALPVAHRAATHRALQERGYAGEDEWLYMMKSNLQPAAAGSNVDNSTNADVNADNDDMNYELSVERSEARSPVVGSLRADTLNMKATTLGDTATGTPATTGSVVGEASFAVEADDVGVLWWIGVQPGERGRGYGSRILQRVETELASRGANQIILFVDHDEPDSAERSRVAAIKLYEKHGYDVIDHLYSYNKGVTKNG